MPSCTPCALQTDGGQRREPAPLHPGGVPQG